MSNTSTACKLCHRLPGLVNLDGLCRDDFELVNVTQPMAAYRQHMQSMIKIAAEVQKAYRRLQGVDPSAVYNPVKHFCKCGFSDISYMTLAEHINSEGGPAMGHTFRESVEDAPRRVPSSSNGPKKAAAPAAPRRPKWDPSLA